MVNLTLFPYHKSHDITHWYDLLEHVICLIRTLFKGREFSVFCLSMCVFVSYNFNGIPDMFVLQAEYFHKRLFPGTPWMHSIQLLWKCTSSAVFCRVPQMHISCSSFAKFLHLIFLYIHHWIPLVFFPGINLILSYPHSPLHWILLIWGLTSSHSESHIPRDW